MAPSEPRGWPRRVVWHPKHFHTVYLGATHPYHALGPLNGPLRHSWGPQKGSFRTQMALLGAPEVLGGPRGARFGPDCPPLARLGWTHGHHTLSPGIGPFWAPGDPKRARFGPKCPFWGSGRAPRGQISSRLPPIGPPWMDSCSPHTLTWYRAPSGSPGGQKGLFGPDT